MLDIKQQITELVGMTVKELQAKHQEVFGEPSRTLVGTGAATCGGVGAGGGYSNGDASADSNVGGGGGSNDTGCP